MIGKRRKQAGDTIVEVLIAISVISLVLAGAYVATNRSTRSTLDTQEHGQALKLVETQIEFLRAAALAAGSSYDFAPVAHPNNKCFDQRGTEQPPGSPGHDPCTVQGDGSPAAVGQEPAYQLTITKPAAPGNPYTISAVWDTPIGSSPNDGTMTMYYRPD